MKLATFIAPETGAPCIGALTKDATRLVDLAAEHQRRTGSAAPEFASMQVLIESADAGLDKAQRMLDGDPAITHALNAVRLLAPIPLPLQIRDCMCFEQHLLGSMEAAARITGKPVMPENSGMYRVFQARPIYYKANRFATTGPDTDIHWPAYSKLMDYELEMACIIGRAGRDIASADARSHIFGYTVFNDLSARDTQMAEMESGLGPSKSKDFDNANVFGPWIVTADAFDPGNARMTVRINGAIRSEGSSVGMKYRFEDLIAFISRSETLHAGEILCSGTVGGGCGLERSQLLSDGDTIELEIEGIGTLRNRIFASKSGGVA